MKIIAKEQEKLIKYLIHNVQGLSFGQTQKLLRKGDIKINGKKTKENVTINIGDEIDIYMPKTNIPTIDILYEDDNILIVNKPAQIECATRDKSSENTYSLEEIFSSKNAIVVHRLDRLTEGLVILAKSKDIAREFEAIFRTRQIKKCYVAGVQGKCNLNGIYTAFLVKDSQKSIVHISQEQKDNSKEIISEFNTCISSENISLVNVILHTGRTHQIRSHLKFLNYPIINDSKYGKNNTKIVHDYPGYFLTANKLEFNISGNLKYLNNLKFEITPSWLKYVDK